MSSPVNVRPGNVADGASYLGVDVTHPEPLFQSVVFGGCFRINKSKLGIVVDDQDMILQIDKELKQSGVDLLEGDRIIKINDRRFLSGKRSFASPHHEYLLHNPPGTELEIEWIRPGVGVRKAVLKTLDNPPTHVNYPDSFDRKTGEAKKRQKHKSQRYQ